MSDKGTYFLKRAIHYTNAAIRELDREKTELMSIEPHLRGAKWSFDFTEYCSALAVVKTAKQALEDTLATRSS